MKLFTYIFITLTLSSCIDQASNDIEFKLFNETDKTVKVLGFDTRLDINNNIGKANPIVINPNSSFKVIRVTGIDNDTGFRFYSIQGVDSVRVIFDDLKVKTFGGINDDTPYDIFTGGDDNKSFITEQDYESAEDCSRDCE